MPAPTLTSVDAPVDHENRSGGTAGAPPVFSPTRLRAARQARGLTQARMADAIGRTLPTYRRYECGDWQPSLTAVVAMAGALQVNVGDLFDHGDQPAPAGRPEGE